MKFLPVILFFLSLNLTAQKEIQRKIDASGLQSIIIDSDEVYRVTIRTAAVKLITISSRADGEYYNEIHLDPDMDQNTLYLQSQFRKKLQSGFDKLSAHKVFAMEVTLEIPNDMNIQVRSNVASVHLKGKFKNVILELKSGSGYLKDFSGNAVVNTYNGNIEVESNYAVVEAESRHGRVIVPQIKTGDNHLKLTSINGDIKVMETK